MVDQNLQQRQQYVRQVNCMMVDGSRSTGEVEEEVAGTIDEVAAASPAGTTETTSDVTAL